MAAPRPPAGWQFTRAAILAREVTARLFGPPLGWLLHGPAVVGGEHLDELDEPVIVCPTHESHLDSSTIRLALGPRYRRRLAVAADYFSVSRRAGSSRPGSAPSPSTGPGEAAPSRS
jgi:hypothetical protein